MTRLTPFLLTVALITTALVTGACTTARMRVPGPLRGDAETWSVHKKTSWTRLRALRMAGFVASDIDHTWTSSRRTSWMGSYDKVKRRQGYSFAFGTAQARQWRVYCDARYLGEKVHLGRTIFGDTDYVEGTTALGCRVTAPGRRVGDLRMAGVPHGRLRGDMRVDDVVLGIESVHYMEGSRIPNGDPTGYALFEDGRMVAAVQAINDPVVYVVPDADPRLRNAIALTASTLIMYTPLDEGEDRSKH